MPDARCLLFFISGHGFGHASRDVEVINALARREFAPRVIIRSDVNAGLLKRTIRVPFELRPGPCDTGIVQTNSVTHDDDATVREALEFYRRFDAHVETEVRALADADVGLIVGDIAPLAFEVAARLGVPSVALANFTWDWIYEWYPALKDDEAWLLARIRQAYAKATLALELPFAGGFDVFPAIRRIPLIARHATRRRPDTRAHFGLPPDRRVALLSFGGYGLPSLDIAAVDCLDAWTIVTTDRVRSRAGRLPAQVLVLPETAFADTGFRYEDLVAAVDVVVTKPGYGILAESIACGTAMLYTSRGRFREYDLLVREMPRFVRCRFIDQNDLFAGRWRAALDALVGQPQPPETMPTNGADVAADVLSAFASAGRTPAAGS